MDPMITTYSVNESLECVSFGFLPVTLSMSEQNKPAAILTTFCSVESQNTMVFMSLTDSGNPTEGLLNTEMGELLFALRKRRDNKNVKMTFLDISSVLKISRSQGNKCIKSLKFWFIEIEGD